MKRGFAQSHGPSKFAKVEPTEDAELVGEVRFESTDEAHAALAMDGANLNGSQIRVDLDLKSQDGTKIIINGLTGGTSRNDLRDVFKDFGNVKYAGLISAAGRGVGGQGSGGTKTGEVRFETIQEMEHALQVLNGLDIQGYPIRLEVDHHSKDGTKLLVSGIPPSAEWQELKDFCAQAGRVAYAGVSKGAGKGAGKGAASAEGRGTFSAPVRSCHGEVRYESAATARLAAQRFNKTVLGGNKILVQLDLKAEDGARLIVHNLPSGFSWQDLKNHFSRLGPVAFAQVIEVESQAPSRPMFAAEPPLVPGQRAVGEVRYHSAESSQIAISELSGQPLCGIPVTVKADLTAKLGDKVLVIGMTTDISLSDLRTFMSAAGAVANAKIVPIAQPGQPASRGPRAAAAAPVYTAPATTAIGEVRFENPADAHLAIQRFNGAFIDGRQITVMLEQKSMDQSKVVVTRLQPTMRWQDLKEIFQEVGPVAHALIVGQTAPGYTAKGAKGAGRERIISTAGAAGEVRFNSPQEAEAAVQHLDQSDLRGSYVSVQVDPRSKDGTRCLVSNLPEGIEWQELKDHFASIGDVAYAGIFGPGEVRMSSREEALQAVLHLDGAEMDGQAVTIQLDPSSTDGTKLFVDNLPASCHWQELKDFFSTVGTVLYAARQGRPK